MTDTTASPHLSEAEIAALIYAVGQNRDHERRAYSHLAICAECTRLVGSLRDFDRDTASLLSSLDVAAPTQSVDSIIRAARRHQTGFAFGWRRAAAVVGFLVATAAAAAAIPASPLHHLLMTMLGSSEGNNANSQVTSNAPQSEGASPAVSMAAKPGSVLDVSFNGGVGGSLDVQIVDPDQITLSSPSPDAIYRVSANRIAVEHRAPATFHLQVPRSLRELRVRVGTEVVFARQPVTSGAAEPFTIQLTRPNASR